jgi:hypothetical protein
MRRITVESIAYKESTLEEIKEEFEQWRQNRKGKQEIPDKLWNSATELSKYYSINKIAKALGLGHSALKKRVKDLKGNNSSTFVEFQLPKTVSSVQWTVEMEKPNGAKLKMNYQGKVMVELFEIGKLFWQEHEQ